MSKNFKINEIFIKKSGIKLNDKNFFNIKNNVKINLQLIDLTFFQESDDNYITTMGLKISGTTDNEVQFEIEVEYYAKSTIEGFSNDDVFRIQHINIANVLFPYIRSECNRLMADTKIPKFQIQLIDFANIYFSKYEKKEDV